MTDLARLEALQAERVAYLAALEAIVAAKQLEIDNIRARTHTSGTRELSLA